MPFPNIFTNILYRQFGLINFGYPYMMIHSFYFQIFLHTYHVNLNYTSFKVYLIEMNILENIDFVTICDILLLTLMLFPNIFTNVLYHQFGLINLSYVQSIINRVNIDIL